MSPANYLDRHMSGGGRGGAFPARPDAGVEIKAAIGRVVEGQTAFLDPAQQPQEAIGAFGPAQQSHKRRRRQKKKRGQTQASAVEPHIAFPDAADKSDEVPAQQQLKPIGDEEPVRQTHRQKRWKMFQEMRQQFGPSKQDKVRYNRVVEAMKNATTVPIEIVDLRPSLKLRHEPRIYQHGELARLGITTIQWDGIDSVPVKTPSGIVIAVLAGRPRSSGWDERMKSLTSGIEAAGNLMTFQTGGNWHHRGAYPGINTGISYGGGSQCPGEIDIGGIRNKDAIAGLRSNPLLGELVRYVDSVFSDYAPDLHSFCKARLAELEKRDPQLQRPFKDAAFGAMSFNFGSDPCAVPHKDFKHLGFGWCSITSLGEFDATRGGHLVLWDFDIAIEFPPHSTVLIPSAILEHSNTAIQDGENRTSITQYNPAGIFEWIAYGFQPRHIAESFGKEPAEWWSKPKQKFSPIF